jgi:predicted acylesterase/phospholipase RssA
MRTQIEKTPCQTLLLGIFCFTLLTIFLQGCAAPIRYPVPEEMTKNVRPLQLDPSTRAFIDIREMQQVNDFFSNSLTPVLYKYSNSGEVLTLLALSGGGDSGAFGAGFLNGWTEAETRPMFDVVTGISTGALMAPFAFLGPEEDESLKAFYTGISSEDVFFVRSLRKIISSRDAIGDSLPLAQMLEKHVDEKVLEKIGMEHKKGRRLFIGTTHLDSGRLVVWDMGTIALSNHPDAPALFRDVMLASASVPIAFPPVYIAIDADEKKYDEMHVDGGLINQVFGIEALAHLLTREKKAGNRINARVYLIRNSEIAIDWQPISRKVADIGSRTVEIMINTQSLGDIFRNYVIARHIGIEFYLAGIQDDLEIDHPAPFDPGYMKELFDVGYEMGRGDKPFQTSLPGLESIMILE